MDFPSFDDIFRVARDEALARNPKLTLDAIEREGSDANVIVAAAAAAADEVVGALTRATAALYLDSAKGLDLDKYVYDRYGLTRQAASPAVGSVTFQTATANPSAFTIPTGTLLGTAAGLQFTTTDPDVTFPAGSTSVTVNVRSTLAGADQQANASTITSIISQITGSPVNLTVTNPQATAGAGDEEKDSSLRERARRFFQTARRGTLAAIENGALAVSGVRTAKAFEIVDTSGRPARIVTLIISDQFTDALANLSTVPPAYATQSQTLATTVFTSLSDVRAAGIYVNVIVGVVILQSIQLALAFDAGADVNKVATEARASVVAYTNSLAPGATWSRAAAQSALQSVQGLAYSGAEIVSPAGDIVPTALKVIRTTMRLVTAFTPNSILS